MVFFSSMFLSFLVCEFVIGLNVKDDWELIGVVLACSLCSGVNRDCFYVLPGFDTSRVSIWLK